MAQQATKLLCIIGPTASGKSALAVELARTWNGEVISADSRQVYRGLDIGTGKITKREMKGVPHHLLDIVSPKKIFTAHDFLIRARQAIADISARGKLPIICGGTGFYIDALLGRIELPDVPPNIELRRRLVRKENEELFVILKKTDPARSHSIDPANKRRLIRALEIAHAIGKNPPLKKSDTFDVSWIGLQLAPDELHERINRRLAERLKQGMVAEAKKLHAAGLSYKRMNELGLEYRSLARFLQNEISREQLETELRPAIWQYAKRQMTYLRRNMDIRWFSPDEAGSVSRSIDAFLRRAM